MTGAVAVGAWAVTWVGAALLVASGLAKLGRPLATAQSLALSGFPSSPAAARLLGAGEVTLGAVVLASRAPVAAAGLGLAYLAFAVVAARQFAAGASSCGCFGEVDAPLSQFHVAVNGILATAAVVAAAAGTTPVVDGPVMLALAAVTVVTGAMMVRALLVLLPALADGTRRLGADT